MQWEPAGPGLDQGLGHQLPAFLRAVAPQARHGVGARAVGHGPGRGLPGERGPHPWRRGVPPSPLSWQPPTHPQVPPQELLGERGMKGNCRAGQRLPMRPGPSVAAGARSEGAGETPTTHGPRCTPGRLSPAGRGSRSLWARGSAERDHGKPPPPHDGAARSQGHPPCTLPALSAFRAGPTRTLR